MDAVLYEFTSEAYPPEEFPDRERKGRPDFSGLCVAESEGISGLIDDGPILYEFTSEAYPPEEFPDRERKGRPERSPSLPPPDDEPGPTPPG